MRGFADLIERDGFDARTQALVVAVAEAVEFVEGAGEGEGVVALVADGLRAEELCLRAIEFRRRDAIFGEFADFVRERRADFRGLRRIGADVKTECAAG